MSMMKLMGAFATLQSEVDTDAIALLVKFTDRAIKSGNPKEFLKGALRAVVEAPETRDGKVQVVEVKVFPKKK